MANIIKRIGNKMRERIRELQEEISRLEDLMETQNLLREIWDELGPYTPHISNELRYKLQKHFYFDDSE